MSRISRRAIDDTVGRLICLSRYFQGWLLEERALRRVIFLVLSGLVLSIFVGKKASSEELSPDRFRKMVQAEQERRGDKIDSVGTTLKVMAFGDATQDFMLVPVIRGGKLVAVYKDDPKRNGVTPLANAAVLKSVRLDLLSEIGAHLVLQDKGYTSGNPIAVSVGPCSLFGVLETGWYLTVGESFVLLSLEGRVVSESDVAHFWPGKLATCRQIRDRLRQKE